MLQLCQHLTSAWQELEIARAQHADHGRLVSERLASAQRRSRELEEVEEEARGLRRQARVTAEERHGPKSASVVAMRLPRSLSGMQAGRVHDLVAC
jgi:hypothetical protein